MVVSSRAHLVTVEMADGATGNRNFNLNAGSRLQHLAIAVSGAGAAPLRVNAALIQPRASSNIFMKLVGGWIRGSGSNPAGSHDLVWDGDLEIDTDMALRIGGRNDTGVVARFTAGFLVIE